MDNISYVKITDNQFCPPYPDCVINNIGTQDTTGCTSIPKRQFYLYDECYIIEDTDSLNLANSGLSGPIPNEIGELTNLKYLFLYGNHFSGEIPPEIWNLENLSHLYLYDNDLSGPIPSDIQNLTSLTHLFLQNNQFNGELPSELNALIDLEYLYLNDNHFSGYMDSDICDLGIDWSNSLYYDLSNNYFCEPYPSCMDGQIGYQDTTNCASALSVIEAIPEKFTLYDAYPNPFNPNVTIDYYLPEGSLLDISIFDLSGRIVRNLFHGNKDQGFGSMRWDGKDKMGRPVGAGAYLYSVRAGFRSHTKKFVLLK